MGRNNRKKRKILLLFIVILITSVVLVVETYAWFVGLSTVNTNSFNISISSGSGLEISMDGEHWHKDDDVLVVNAATIAGTSTDYPTSNAYSNNTNSWVDSNGLVPVSSSGALDTSTGRLNFFEKSSLSSTPGGYKLIADPVDHSSGEAKSYVAFDLFIRNGTDNVYNNSNYDDVAAENIYLKYTSSANVNGTTGYGAANSLRVGFFMLAGMKASGATAANIRSLSCSSTTSTSTNIRKLCPANGGNRALYWNVWEPNHTLHTEAVSNYFNNVCKRRNSSGYLTTPCDALSSTTQTYPIKTAITSENNVDIYDGLNSYTTNISGTNAKLSSLVTYKTPGSADAYTESSQLFKLAGNSITRVRVYIWLEGQDPDNYDIIAKDNNVSVKFGFTKDRYDLESQYTYTTTTNDIYVDTDITNFTKYSNFEEAKNSYGHPVAIAHETENGKVKASYVAFEKNNKIYYLKGGVNEQYATEKTVYNKNIEVLKEAFGPNWQSVCSTNGNHFSCTDGSYHAYAEKYGYINANGDEWHCFVFKTSQSYCGTSWSSTSEGEG